MPPIYFNSSVHLHPALAADANVWQMVERDAEDIIVVALFFWGLYLMLIGCRDQERATKMKRALRHSTEWLQRSLEESSKASSGLLRRASQVILGQPVDSSASQKDQLPTRRAMV